MCAACVEYVKEKLTTDEFKSALKEVTREDKKHFNQVEKLINENQGNDEKLRDVLKSLDTEARDY